MPNIIRVQEKNLVLKLSNNVNRNIWNDSKYYDFIDNLTNRPFKKNYSIFDLEKKFKKETEEV